MVLCWVWPSGSLWSWPSWLVWPICWKRELVAAKWCTRREIFLFLDGVETCPARKSFVTLVFVAAAKRSSMDRINRFCTGKSQKIVQTADSWHYENIEPPKPPFFSYGALRLIANRLKVSTSWTQHKSLSVAAMPGTAALIAQGEVLVTWLQSISVLLFFFGLVSYRHYICHFFLNILSISHARSWSSRETPPRQTAFIWACRHGDGMARSLFWRLNCHCSCRSCPSHILAHPKGSNAVTKWTRP